jgi:hypothetical protein
MNQEYLAALWQEMAAWRELEAGLRDQRRAIISRDVDGVWQSQERLQELVRQAGTCRVQAHQLRPAEVDMPTRAVKEEAGAVRQQVRQAMALNFELLRDVCSYLEMVREVAFPHTVPPTYRHPREAGPAAGRQALTGTRIA